ncbi:VOC family protein [Motiliproteus sp. MSK22-1]|uniref:VOC family protein n=1 Tax=Motiliproteus sp. MSK22-1 TaxID=1897630 RepID=UPI000976F86B|nr:VOC family protein [Motiliproteus sp. MSK22-1]OMH25820.1 glyoxalase [Motiliproteus sp. MSK22-1]
MKMNYFVVGTNDMEASVKFYDSLFKETGINQVLAGERMTFWQDEEADFAFAVAKPFDGEEATNGNGTMVGFGVSSIEEVKKLHKKAIDLGGANEGDPNQRGPKFSAYVRDLDKNKIVFACDVA